MLRKIFIQKSMRITGQLANVTPKCPHALGAHAVENVYCHYYSIIIQPAIRSPVQIYVRSINPSCCSRREPKYPVSCTRCVAKQNLMECAECRVYVCILFIASIVHAAVVNSMQVRGITPHTHTRTGCTYQCIR